MEKNRAEEITEEKKLSVSIVIPVYNVEAYLEECLDSILQQTFQEFELILVDDGSTDRSGEICDEYAAKDSRIKVVHQTNQGQSAARNHGVRVAQNDWIVFIDSDDVVHPQLVEFLVRSVIDSGAKMGFSSRVEGETIPDGFFALYDFECSAEDVTVEKLEEHYDAGADCYWAPFPSIVLKQIVLDQPFENGRIYEDNAIGCRWLYAAGKIAQIPQALYFYRQNPNGTMNQKLSMKKLDYLWALQQQIDFYKRLDCQSMIRKSASALLDEALNFYFWAQREKNAEIKKRSKKEIKAILKAEKEWLILTEHQKDKVVKSLHPLVHRLKKRLR